MKYAWLDGHRKAYPRPVPRSNHHRDPVRSHLHGALQDHAQHRLRRSERRLRQVGDKIWLVTFMDYDLGFFDEETTRLEPIVNPSEAKVLPMCPE